jgi:hypothetical protein
MATTTPNYGWDVPTSSDYVKLGAQAIETLGDDIDATLWTALGGNYPGLRLVKKQTIGTGVSVVTVTGAFSAAYENYKIIVNGGVASTSNYAQLILGSTATGYNQKSWYGSYTNNTVAGAGYSNFTRWEGLLKGSTSSLVANFELQSPFLTKTTGIDYNSKEMSNGGIVESGSGFLNDGNSYTSFTFTANTGTWTGGTIYVYGYGIS